MWRACKVCWAVKYLAKIERAENLAATKGKKIHSILECYLRDGTPIDPSDKLGRLALPGIQYLPTPGTAIVEEWYNFSIGDVALRGAIDFYYTRADGTAVVGDHKTTKNFKYALREDQLLTDVQSNLYAAYISKLLAKSEVELNWVYYKSEGVPEAMLIKNTVNLVGIADCMGEVLADCNEMLEAIRLNKTPYDFSPPEAGCNWYGGCMAKDFALAQTGGTMAKSLLEDLKKNQLHKVATVTHTEVKQVAKEDLKEDDHIFIGDTVVPAIMTDEEDDLIIDEEGAFVPFNDDNPNNFTLLIDCDPIKFEGKTYDLHQVLYTIKSCINRKYKVAHYKFIEYGKGPAALAVACDQRLGKGYLVNNEIVLVDSKSQEAADVLHIFEKYAKQAVRGRA